MLKLGLIGSHLSHSFSASYFTKKFAKQHLKHSYYNLEITDLSELRARISELEWNGFNVTIPHKEAILPYLDEIDSNAQAIGAVNCVKVLDNGSWKGYNTDWIGFKQSLRPYHDELKGASALVLGSGGASKAVCYALESLGVKCFVVSRDSELNYTELSASLVRSCKLVVNTTPLGMHPDLSSSPDIPYEAIGRMHLAYDLTYNPEKTRFLQKCEILGADIMNGQQMLELQAEQSWDIWNA